tara:strand:- start:1192 stop:1401 length:210 start_codon:yes stop_codon:yes gene_type:complete
MDNNRVTRCPDVRDERAEAEARIRTARAALPPPQGRRLDLGQPEFDPNNHHGGQVEQLGNQVDQMNLNH